VVPINLEATTPTDEAEKRGDFLNEIKWSMKRMGDSSAIGRPEMGKGSIKM
jgi:hypothetical protein